MGSIFSYHMRMCICRATRVRRVRKVCGGKVERERKNEGERKRDREREGERKRE